MSSARDRDYFITTDILEYVLHEKIKYHIMERSHYMNYIPRLNVETNNVKLFGNNNYFVDSSKWVSIEIETRVNDTLEFSFSNKFLIMKFIFQHFKVNIQEDEIVSLLEHNQILKIEDIFNILGELMLERSI
jgi:hypothetical protein